MCPLVVKYVFPLIVIHVDREEYLRFDHAYDERRIDVICHIVSSVKRTGAPSGLRIEDRIPDGRENKHGSCHAEPDDWENGLYGYF